MSRKAHITYAQLLEINRLCDDGMSQAEVARCLGVSKSVVSREVGTDWTLERLIALVRSEEAPP